MISRTNSVLEMSAQLECQTKMIKTLISSHPFTKGLALVRMKYHGRETLKSQGMIDEISIYQQHCGGNAVCVFNDSVVDGGTFSFTSQRHSSYSFSLTFYVNSQQAGRVSTCCEYKHKWMAKLGGVQGMFSFESVTGGEPCSRCQGKSKKKRSKRVITSPKEINTNLKIPVEPERHTPSIYVDPAPETSDEECCENDNHENCVTCFSNIRDDLKIPVDNITSSPEATDTESQCDQKTDEPMIYRKKITGSDYEYLEAQLSSSTNRMKSND